MIWKKILSLVRQLGCFGLIIALGVIISGCGTTVYVLRDNESFPVLGGTQIQAADGQYRTTADKGYFMTEFWLKEVKNAKLKDPSLNK